MRNSLNQNTKLVWRLILGCALFAIFPALSYADCANCVQLQTALQKKIKLKAAMEDVKSKNKKYLETHPGASISIQMKVQSNLVISDIKIETFANEMLFLNSEIQKGCAQCQVPQSKGN